MNKDRKNQLFDLLDYHGVNNKALVDSLIEFITEYGLEIANNIQNEKQAEQETNN